MYIGYINDRQDLDFLCLKDVEVGNQMTLIVRTGVMVITVTILANLGDLEVMNQLPSEKPSHERLVSSIRNQKLNTLKYYRNRGFTVPTENVRDDMNSEYLIIDLRGGSLPENPDHKKMDETLKESVEFEKLQKSMISKSVEDSGSLNDRSFNKIVLGVLDKLEPIIGNPKFLRLLAETQKPVKSELPISMEGSSKATMDPKPQKPSAKRSSSIFAEAALMPINPHRWPAFTAGSAMASDMPDVKDKLQNPLDNLRVAKEYLETAQSDIQWRDRFWKITQDTTTINMASELGGDGGSFVAGAASNKIADGYMDEMVLTEVTKNQQEKLNLEMFKQTAREQGMDVSKVRGTGLTREFVPEFMQGDICERPERNARPDSW